MRLSKSLNLSLDTTNLATMATMSGTNPPLLLLLMVLRLVLVLGEMAELDNKIKQTSSGEQATVVKSIFVCLILRKEVTNDNEDDASDDDDDDDRRSTIDDRVLPYKPQYHMVLWWYIAYKYFARQLTILWSKDIKSSSAWWPLHN